MGESRGELLLWLNETLNFPCKKIEECGTGVVYFFILDSIYKDIALQKVNLNARHEYEYITNYKLLQSLFDKKGIQCNIPVDRLVKCKFQDNLEFLQRMKKFWMKQQSSCDKYDSLSKIASLESQSRRASDVSAANSSPMARTSHKAPPLYSKVKMSPARATNSHPHKKNAASTAAAAVGAHKEKADLFQHTEDADSDDLIKQIKFYYWKLCNIEGALQTFYDESGKVDPLECLEEIRTILYETEEGFEIPLLEDSKKSPIS